MGLDHTLAAGIEFDLRHYRRWKARLAELDTLLADVRRPGMAAAGAGVQSAPGDPTVGQVREREHLWLEQERLLPRVRRVENFLTALTAEQRHLVELRYFEDRDRGEVCLEMSISRAEFYRLRDEALQVYAEVAGLATLATA